MRRFLRLALLNSISLFVVSAFYPGLIVTPLLTGIVYAGAVFTLINYLVKPIVKLLLLPINLVTLGLFRWLSNVLILLTLTRLLSTVSVVPAVIPSLAYQGFVVPQIAMVFPASLIISSFLLSFVFTLLNWLLTK